MNIIFVGGAQRTGTTKLQEVLCADDTVQPRIKEASYFRMLIQAYKFGKDDFNNDTADYYKTLEEFLLSNRRMVGEFLGAIQEKHPSVGNFVLKEPHLTMYFPEVWELIPQARFIMIVREAKDAIASMMRVGEKMAEKGARHFFQNRDMKEMVNYYKSFYVPVCNCTTKQFKENVCYIKYEDFARNTDEVLTRLREFTGLRLDRGIDYAIDDEIGRDSKQPKYYPWFTENYSKPMNASSIGNHKSVLTSLESEQIDTFAQDFNTLFGYAHSG